MAIGGLEVDEGEEVVHVNHHVTQTKPSRSRMYYPQTATYEASWLCLPPFRLPFPSPVKQKTEDGQQAKTHAKNAQQYNQK